LSAYGSWGKRAVDLASLAALLPAVLPLILIISAAVRLSLGSPVLFRQVRPGLRGKPFRIYKFRTMHDLCDASGGLLSDAERLTRFGRLLRSTSLDELPSFWNVLRGEMSLIGPRPLLMEYVPLYSAQQARRHEVLPGVTGWAQVNGRNALTWEDKLRLDVWYVDHVSLALDLRILACTVWSVIRREGISAQGHATFPRFTGTQAPGTGSTEKKVTRI
jgi:lipopolysaccharide/colanic/teichoic acid biosynthesis glycosyltransferase